MKTSLTLNELRAMSPCSIPSAIQAAFEARPGKPVTLAAALKAGVSLSNLLWVAGKLAANDDEMLARILEFSLATAETVAAGASYWPAVKSASETVIALLREGVARTDKRWSLAADAAAYAADAAADAAAYAAYAADAAADAAAYAARAAYAAYAAYAAAAAAYAARAAYAAATAKHRKMFAAIMRRKAV